MSRDLRDVLKAGDRIRIGTRLCRIHETLQGAVDIDCLRLHFCWIGEGSVKAPTGPSPGLCIYRLPPQAKLGRLWTLLGQIMYENQLTQSLLRQYCIFHLRLAGRQEAVAKSLHRWLPKFADDLERWSRQHRHMHELASWWTLDWQIALDVRERKYEREMRQRDALTGQKQTS